MSGAHATLAALLATDRYLLALVKGTGRLWAACEAVRVVVGLTRFVMWTI